MLRKALSFEGEVFRNNDLARMITQVLPELRKRVDVDLAVATLPEAVEALPKLNIHAAVIDDIAVFTPRIVYGDPPLSELSCEGYRLLSQSQVPRRNRDRELALIQELRNDTGLVFERNNERRGLTAISTLQSASKYLSLIHI